MANLHSKHEECPPWCHFCPHMGGMVFPHCYGTACAYSDEDDLMHCTCDPSAPEVTRAELAGYARTLSVLLRDKRRARRADRGSVRRLMELAKLMRGNGQPGQRAAWDEVVLIARRLETSAPEAAESIQPPTPLSMTQTMKKRAALASKLFVVRPHVVDVPTKATEQPPSVDAAG